MRYVGFTTDPQRRLQDHIKASRYDKSIVYRNHWIKSVLDKGSNIELLVIEQGKGSGWEEREIYWIKWYRFIMGPKLTNLTDGGEGALGCTGRECTQETRQKLSAAGKGKKRSPEIRAKFCEIQQALAKERPKSEEHRAKISKTVKERWANDPDYRQRCSSGNIGKVLSEEEKEHLRKLNTGKKMSPEAIAKYKASRKDYSWSEEHRAKQLAIRANMSEEWKRNIRAASQKPKSEETKRKMSESGKRRVARERLAKQYAALLAYSQMSTV